MSFETKRVRGSRLGLTCGSQFWRQRAELLHEREEIGHAPVVGDLAVAHPHDVDGLELDLAACRLDAEEFSAVCPVIGLVRRDAVSIGKLPMDVSVKVGKRGLQ